MVALIQLYSYMVQAGRSKKKRAGTRLTTLVLSLSCLLLQHPKKKRLHKYNLKGGNVSRGHSVRTGEGTI